MDTLHLLNRSQIRRHATAVVEAVGAAIVAKSAPGATTRQPIARSARQAFTATQDAMPVPLTSTVRAMPSA